MPTSWRGNRPTDSDPCCNPRHMKVFRGMLVCSSFNIVTITWNAGMTLNSYTRNPSRC